MDRAIFEVDKKTEFRYTKTYSYAQICGAVEKLTY